MAPGPQILYDLRVKSGLIREDEVQRAAVLKLQNLHDSLASYSPPQPQRLILEQTTRDEVTISLQSSVSLHLCEFTELLACLFCLFVLWQFAFLSGINEEHLDQRKRARLEELRKALTPAFVAPKGLYLNGPVGEALFD